MNVLVVFEGEWGGALLISNRHHVAGRGNPVLYLYNWCMPAACGSNPVLTCKIDC